jgi:hypothetical protein
MRKLGLYIICKAVAVFVDNNMVQRLMHGAFSLPSTWRSLPSRQLR